MLDRIVRGGTVVDGTGAPARPADVGVRGGRIVEVGEVSDDAREVIDASGCIVAPGFIDPHTHLDAQLCWDPAATPTCFHGVTTVVIGLCGFGVAPCPPGGGDYLLRSLEVVEEIPFESTSRGVPFDWSTWPEFLRAIERRDPGVNVAGFVPHSALRCFAMGERARGEAASPADMERMREELRRGLRAGAVGLASSRGPNHQDAFGDPVPSRFASDEELGGARAGVPRTRLADQPAHQVRSRRAGADRGGRAVRALDRRRGRAPQLDAVSRRAGQRGLEGRARAQRRAGRARHPRRAPGGGAAAGRAAALRPAVLRARGARVDRGPVGLRRARARAATPAPGRSVVSGRRSGAAARGSGRGLRALVPRLAHRALPVATRQRGTQPGGSGRGAGHAPGRRPVRSDRGGRARDARPGARRQPLHRGRRAAGRRSRDADRARRLRGARHQHQQLQLPDLRARRAGARARRPAARDGDPSHDRPPRRLPRPSRTGASCAPAPPPTWSRSTSTPCPSARPAWRTTCRAERRACIQDAKGYRWVLVNGEIALREDQLTGRRAGAAVRAV